MREGVAMIVSRGLFHSISLTCLMLLTRPLVSASPMTRRLLDIAQFSTPIVVAYFPKWIISAQLQPRPPPPSLLCVKPGLMNLSRTQSCSCPPTTWCAGTAIDMWRSTAVYKWQHSLYCLLHHASLELLAVELKLKQGLLTLVLFYRPPTSPLDFEDLENAILSLNPSWLKNCVLLGDFNVDLSCSSQSSIDLLASLSSFHFMQVVKEPTRVTKNSAIIDHIYLTNTSLLSSCSTTTPLGSSNHKSLQLSLNWSKWPQKPVTRRIWKYSRADWDAIRSDLDSLPSPGEDIVSSWSNWSSQFLSTLSNHISTKVCKFNSSLPWMSNGLFTLFRKRDIAFAKYKSCKSSSSLGKFRLLRNKSVGAFALLSSFGQYTTR